MFQNLLRAAMFALILTVAACGADTPQEQIVAIDEMLAKKVPMTDAQKQAVETGLAEGKALLAAGKTEDAKKAFDGVIAVLKMAIDADIYNKAD